MQKLRPSVLKVRGRAPSCSRALEGTGFVIAPERVMTNAHVVAGTNEVTVEVGRGQFDATVVHYDPQTDVAVLAVPDLEAHAAAVPVRRDRGRARTASCSATRWTARTRRRRPACASGSRCCAVRTSTTRRP